MRCARSWKAGRVGHGRSSGRPSRSCKGPNFVPYKVDAEGRLPHVRAGDALEIETEYIRNPVTKETIHPRLALPEGLVVKDCALVASTRFKFNADKVRYDHSGRYAAFGFFQYFGP